MSHGPNTETIDDMGALPDYVWGSFEGPSPSHREWVCFLQAQEAALASAEEEVPTGATATTHSEEAIQGFGTMWHSQADQTDLISHPSAVVPTTNPGEDKWPLPPHREDPVSYSQVWNYSDEGRWEALWVTQDGLWYREEPVWLEEEYRRRKAEYRKSLGELLTRTVFTTARTKVTMKNGEDTPMKTLD